MTALSNIPNADFFENFSEAILITNAGGELLTSNKAFEKLTGYGSSDVPASITSQLQKAGNGKSAVISISKKTGPTAEVKITGTPITLLDGSTGSVYTFAIASDAEALQKKLDRTVEELEQLAYVASHDLQEPLRTITSYIQLVQKNIDKGNLEATGDFMKFVIEGAGRMQGLINDLLQYSRITKKGNPFIEVDLNTTVKVVQAQMAAKIAEYKASIVVAGLPKIFADPIQMSQLFKNVIDNALKFRSPERQLQLEISVKEENNAYLFAVKDNGIGLEEKFYQRIFVIFQRLHARGEFEGTGLGLAVAKKIVERHGGEMWVESEKDKGSKFYFTLNKNIPE